MPKNRPVLQLAGSNSARKRPTVTVVRKGAGGWQRKNEGGARREATGYTQVSSKKISPSNLEKWAMRKKKIGLISLRNGHIG
jgi:hypothetical protein